MTLTRLPHLTNPELKAAHERYRASHVSAAEFQRMLGHPLPAEGEEPPGFPTPDPDSGHYHAAHVIKYLQAKCAAAPPVSSEDAATLKRRRLGLKW
jgi:hypothetical protein